VTTSKSKTATRLEKATAEVQGIKYVAIKEYASVLTPEQLVQVDTIKAMGNVPSVVKCIRCGKFTVRDSARARLTGDLCHAHLLKGRGKDATAAHKAEMTRERVADSVLIPTMHNVCLRLQIPVGAMVRATGGDGLFDPPATSKLQTYFGTKPKTRHVVNGKFATSAQGLLAISQCAKRTITRSPSVQKDWDNVQTGKAVVKIAGEGRKAVITVVPVKANAK